MYLIDGEIVANTAGLSYERLALTHVTQLGG
jgi:hypothetical protein